MIKLATIFALFALLVTSAFAAGNSSGKDRPRKVMTSLDADGSSADVATAALPEDGPAPQVIRYSLLHASKVKLAIYDFKGHEITCLADEVQRPGEKSVVLRAPNVPAGTYFYRFDAKSIYNPKEKFSQAGRVELGN